MTEEQHNNWYKKQFNNLSEKPPLEVWENISSQLDVQDVWRGIDSKLNSIVRRKTIIRRVSYSLLLLLFFVFFGNYIINWGSGTEHKTSITKNSYKKLETQNIFATKEHKPFQKENNNQTNTHSKYDIKEKQSSTSNNTKHQSYANTSKARTDSSVKTNESANKTIKLITQCDSASASHNPSSVKTEIENKYRIQNSIFISDPLNTNAVKDSMGVKNEETNNRKDVTSISENNRLANINKNNNEYELLLFPIKNSFIPFILNDSIIPQLVQTNNTSDLTNIIQRNIDNEFQGWYAGGIGSANNIWLFNQLAFDGLSPNSLNQTNLNFGSAYGVSFGYNFNSGYGGEMNWLINSQQGQIYSRYNEGRYQTTQVKLSYTIINLTLKHRKKGINKLLNVPKSKNFIIGINCGFLTKSDDNLEQTETKSLYSSMDYGLRFGYEYEVLVLKRIVISSAIKGDFGLKNIYKGNAMTPGSFNRTHTASFGLQLGLKYLFR